MGLPGIRYSDHTLPTAKLASRPKPDVATCCSSLNHDDGLEASMWWLMLSLFIAFALRSSRCAQTERD
jgi:hypothetical protein